MSITGKYKRVTEEGAKEFLIKEGFSPNAAEHKAKMDLLMEFKLEGNKVTRTLSAPNVCQVDEFHLGQTFREVVAEHTFMTLPTIDGNTLILTSRKEDGSEGWSRYHYFSDTGIEVLHKASHGETRMYFSRLK